MPFASVFMYLATSGRSREAPPQCWHALDRPLRALYVDLCRRNDLTTVVGRGTVVPDPSSALMGSPVIEMQPLLSNGGRLRTIKITSQVLCGYASNPILVVWRSIGGVSVTCLNCQGQFRSRRKTRVRSFGLLSPATRAALRQSGNTTLPGASQYTRPRRRRTHTAERRGRRC